MIHDGTGLRDRGASSTAHRVDPGRTDLGYYCRPVQSALDIRCGGTAPPAEVVVVIVALPDSWRDQQQVNVVGELAFPQQQWEPIRRRSRGCRGAATDGEHIAGTKSSVGADGARKHSPCGAEHIAEHDAPDY